MFLGFLLELKLKYMFPELLIILFVDDVWFMLAEPMHFMLILRFGIVVWKVFTELVRFMLA